MVTIKDIAQITGVSCTTVSNVINGKDKRVSAETIERINDAIKQLGYVPNMSARSLVSSSSKVIGFINHVVTSRDANFMEDPFHSVFIGVLERILRENGYYLMLRTVATSDELLAFLQNWNVDGLFFTGIFEDDFFKALSSLTIPVILVDSYVSHPHICNIGLEDFKGSHMATSYLLEHGHKNIAFLSPRINGEGVLHQRYEGYRKALLDYNLSVNPNYVFESEMDFASCNKLCDELIKVKGITAIVASADIMAANIMTCLRERGVSIPEDISVVGFDDITLSRVVYPPLTTIHQNMDLKGSLAVEMMLETLENKIPKKSNIILPVSLIERESVRTL